MEDSSEDPVEARDSHAPAGGVHDDAETTAGDVDPEEDAYDEGEEVEFDLNDIDVDDLDEPGPEPERRRGRQVLSAEAKRDIEVASFLATNERTRAMARRPDPDDDDDDGEMYATAPSRFGSGMSRDQRMAFDAARRQEEEDRERDTLLATMARMAGVNRAMRAQIWQGIPPDIDLSKLDLPEMRRRVQWAEKTMQTERHVRAHVGTAGAATMLLKGGAYMLESVAGEMGYMAEGTSAEVGDMLEEQPILAYRLGMRIQTLIDEWFDTKDAGGDAFEVGTLLYEALVRTDRRNRAKPVPIQAPAPPPVSTPPVAAEAVPTSRQPDPPGEAPPVQSVARSAPPKGSSEPLITPASVLGNFAPAGPPPPHRPVVTYSQLDVDSILAGRGVVPASKEG